MPSSEDRGVSSTASPHENANSVIETQKLVFVVTHSLAIQH